MSRSRLLLAYLAFALSGSPVAALHCGGDDPAAMECCRRDGNECNQPGKQDDCCRTPPGGQQGTGFLARLDGVAKPLPAPSFAAGVLPLPDLVGVAESVGAPFRLRPNRAAPGFSPPPSSVLRL